MRRNANCLCTPLPVFAFYSRVLLILALIGVLSTALTFVQVTTLPSS
jgi:hypothetical protein